MAKTRWPLTIQQRKKSLLFFICSLYVTYLLKVSYKTRIVNCLVSISLRPLFFTLIETITVLYFIQNLLSVKPWVTIHYKSTLRLCIHLFTWFLIFFMYFPVYSSNSYEPLLCVRQFWGYSYKQTYRYVHCFFEMEYACDSTCLSSHLRMSARFPASDEGREKAGALTSASDDLLALKWRYTELIHDTGVCLW